MKHGCQHYKKTCSGLKSQQGAFGDFINRELQRVIYFLAAVRLLRTNGHTHKRKPCFIPIAGREKPRDVKELKAM